jgi:hypothetical protein
VDPQQFVQNTTIQQNASFNVSGTGTVGSLVVGPVQNPTASLEVAGSIKASGATFAGTAFGSSVPFGQAASTNVVYGQVLTTATLDPGALSGSINLNVLSEGASNVGMVVILFSAASYLAGADSHAIVYIDTHGPGYNQYITIAERTSLVYEITHPLNDPDILQFNNKSSSVARYTIKVMPFIIHDAVHTGL